MISACFILPFSIVAETPILADNDVVINEIHYNPCSSQGSDWAFEFVELYNSGPSTVDLSSWNFSVAMTFTFPSGTSIAAGEYIVVCSNSSSYSGNGYQVFQWSGGLSNNTERIRLRNSTGTIIDEVNYDDNNGWPDADGNCSTLELVAADTNNGVSNSWAASTVNNGTPGARNSTTIVSGCTNAAATNYNSDANQDDGSCIYPAANAAFTYSLVNAGCGKSTLQFTNTSTGADTYSWDFGAGYATSTQTNPMVEFDGGTSISVSLTASNPDGSNTSTQNITVDLDSSGALVSMEIQPDCYGSELGWTFSNDEGQEIASVASGTYPNDDNATLISETFCLAEDCYAIVLNDAFGDGFHGTIHSGCNLNGSLLFKDASANVIYQYSGVLDWGSVLSDTFCVQEGCRDQLADNYDPNATIDNGTCSYSNATASFTYEIVKNGCGFADIQFTNTSSGATNVTWNFDYNNLTTSEVNPLITVPNGSSLEVHLSAWNDENSDALSTNINIPAAYNQSQINFSFQADCWGAELGWVIRDSANEIVAELSPGTLADEAEPSINTYRYCLSDGCYTIELSDTYGDGFTGGTDYSQCSTDGSYTFTDVNDNVLATFSGAFEFSTSNEHCIQEFVIWNGNTSSDWNTGTNWEGNTVPNESKSVIINTQGQNPALDASVTIQNIIIESGSSLIMDNSSAILNVKNHLVNNGSFSNEDGVVQMNGSSLQLISGTQAPQFYRLKINSSDTVRLVQDIQLWGALQMELGVLDFAGRTVSLLSNANTTGSIGEIKTGAAILGDQITYNRFYPAGQGNWRMMSSPINDATFEQWADDFPTTGFPGSDYPNYPSTANPWSNIRKYNETYINGDEADRNFGFESIENVSDIIGSTAGYFVYFDPNPSTVDVSGTFNKGTQNINLSYSPSSLAGVHDGWNLIANPFPSAIDWDADGLTSNGVSDAIYAFNPNTGQYASYVNGIGVGGFDGLIASGQAFWVKTNEANPSMSIEESAKSNLQGVHLRSTDFSTRATIRITMEGTNSQDEVVLGFNDQSSEGFDPNFDAYKFYPSNSNLPSLSLIPDTSSHEPYSIAISPYPADELWVPLEVKKGNQSDLMLINSELDADDDLCLFLEDLELNQTVPFNLGDVYPFVMSDTSMAQRFVLHIAPPLDISVLDESCPEAANGQIIAQGFGEAPWNFVWRDEMGVIFQESNGLNTADVAENLGPGYYEVSVTGSNQFCPSSTQVIRIEAASPANLTTQTQIASCEELESASISFVMSNNYEWDLTLTNQEGELVDELYAQADSALFAHLNTGIYYVSAENNCGDQMSLEAIDLRDPNKLEFSTGTLPEQVYTNQNVYFNLNCSNCQGLVWDFGDGTSAQNLNNPVHEYQTEGSYEVQLSIHNDFCSSDALFSIEVLDRPEDSGTLADELSYNAEELANSKSENELNKPKFELELEAASIQLKSLENIDEEAIIRVLSIAGQLVFESSHTDSGLLGMQMGTADLAPGIYFIEVKTNNEVLFTEKFMID